MSQSRTLNCYVFKQDDDDPSHNVFPVKTSHADCVGDFREAIKKTLGIVDARMLRLWKTSIPVDSNFKVRLGNLKLDDKEALQPVDGIVEIFRAPPRSFPFFDRNLHIIVRLQSFGECCIAVRYLHLSFLLRVILAISQDLDLNCYVVQVKDDPDPRHHVFVEDSKP
jgi:hypothetical protein